MLPLVSSGRSFVNRAATNNPAAAVKVSHNNHKALDTVRFGSEALPADNTSKADSSPETASKDERSVFQKIADAISDFFKACLNVVLAPFRYIAGFIAGMGQAAGLISDLKSGGYFSDKLRGLSSSNPEFKQNILALTESNKSLPTYQDPHLLDKIGDYIAHKNHQTWMQATLGGSGREREQFAEIIEDLESDDTEANIRAGNALIYLFMTEGIPTLFRDYLVKNIKPTEDDIKKGYPQNINVIASRELDRDKNAFEYKSLKVNSPEYLWDQFKKLFDAQPTLLKEVKDTLKLRKDNHAIGALTEIAFTGQLHYGHKIVFGELNNDPEDWPYEDKKDKEALDNLLSGDTTDMSEAVAYYLKKVTTQREAGDGAL